MQTYTNTDKSYSSQFAMSKCLSNLLNYTKPIIKQLVYVDFSNIIQYIVETFKVDTQKTDLTTKL